MVIYIKLYTINFFWFSLQTSLVGQGPDHMQQTKVHKNYLHSVHLTKFCVFQVSIYKSSTSISLSITKQRKHILVTMENQGTTSNYCPGNFDDSQGFNNNNNIGLDQYNINVVTSDDHTGADELNIVIPTDASDVSGVGTSTTGEQRIRVRYAATADMISSCKRRAPIDDEDAPSRQLIVGESSSFFAQSLNEQVSGQVESFERNVRPRRDQPTVLFPRDQFPNSVSNVLEQQGNSENVPRNMTITPETERETLAHESTNESTSISLGQVSNFGRPAHSGGASSAVREVEHSMSGGPSRSTQISGDRTQSANSPGIAQRMTRIMSRVCFR